ncbi:hypothetical protein JCM3774_005259 [Rhodotorula dairenensis]
MPGYPPDRHGSADRPTHARRRSSTSTLLQTTLLLQPDESRSLGPPRRRSGTASSPRRISRLVGWGALVLLALLSLLLLPGREPARRASAATDANAAPEEATLPELSSQTHRNDDNNAEARLSEPARWYTDAPSATEDSIRGAVLPEPEKNLADLPVCDKTVLFRFAGLHGFGSEVTLMYRVAAVAAHYGYRVFLDDAKWNYGSWADYFHELDLDLDLNLAFGTETPQESSLPSHRCRPPRTGTKRAKLVLSADELRILTRPPPPPSSPAAGGSARQADFVPRWATRPHVVWSTRDMDALDLTYLRLFTNATDLEHLRQQATSAADSTRSRHEPEELGAGTPRPYLTPDETLPVAFEEAFEVMSGVAGRAWRVNDEIEREVASLAERVGVGFAQRQTSLAALEPGDVVLAVHVRLGDKFLEMSHFPSSPASPVEGAAEAKQTEARPDSAPGGLNDALVSAYLAAAIDSVHSLLGLAPLLLSSSSSSSSKEPRWNAGSEATTTAATSSDPDAETRGMKPTLVLMSDDDEGAVRAFRRHPLAGSFRIVGTSEEASPTSTTTDDHDDEGDALDRSRPPEADDLARRERAPIPSGFNENEFNRLPVSSRIRSTRQFVRDLTFLARRADAVVVTGSSNVGRLLMMLSEAEQRRRSQTESLTVVDGVRAGREEGQEEEEGIRRRRGRREMRSLDTRWFPTARYV